MSAVLALPTQRAERVWLSPGDSLLLDGGDAALALAASPSLHLVLFGRTGPRDIHHPEALALHSSAAVRAVEHDADGVRRVLIELGPLRTSRRRHRRPTRRHATGDHR